MWIDLRNYVNSGFNYDTDSEQKLVCDANSKIIFKRSRTSIYYDAFEYTKILVRENLSYGREIRDDININQSCK